MTEQEWKQFVQHAEKGDVLIGVDRGFARQFYTKVPISRIEEKTGHAPYFEKTIVWFAFLGGPLLLLASIPLAARAFGWWTMALAPFSVAAWFVYASLSVRGGSKMVLVTLLLLLAVLGHFSGFFRNDRATVYVLTYVSALWCERLLYWSATRFLQLFVVRNFKAFCWLSDDIRIKTTNGNW